MTGSTRGAALRKVVLDAYYSKEETRVNFVRSDHLGLCAMRRRFVPMLLAVMLVNFYAAGCSDEVGPSSARQLAEFNNAGSLHVPGESQPGRTAHRILAGEVLELTMPAVLRVTTIEEQAEVERTNPYTVRVREGGIISLPVAGEIKAAGKTLAEVESAIIDAYYPKYTATRPSVFARLAEELEQPPFTVIGLVNRPGSFPYPSNMHYNLMQAIGFAGGLNLDLDPRYAMIYRLKTNSEIVNAIFHITDGEQLTKAMTTHIKPGDIVIVEHTPRTRSNAFLNRVFRVSVGTYLRLDDLGSD